MPDRKDINGEHGIMIKMFENAHAENQLLAKLNRDAITEVKEVLRDFIINSPCKKHAEKFEAYDKTKSLLNGTIFSVVSVIIVFAVAWGSLKMEVRNHIDYTATTLEHLSGEISTHRTSQAEE